MHEQDDCKGFSQIRRFMHLSNHVFGVNNLENTKSTRLIFLFFFSKYSKFNVQFRNLTKLQQKCVFQITSFQR